MCLEKGPIQTQAQAQGHAPRMGSSLKGHVRSPVGGQGAERAPLVAECSATMKLKQGMQYSEKHGMPVAVVEGLIAVG